MLSTNTQVNTLSYVAAQQASAGSRSFLPVPPSQYIYAQFEHVSGVPSNEGGISVSKLQILDSLIDNIMKKKSTEKTQELQVEKSHKENIEKLHRKSPTSKKPSNLEVFLTFVRNVRSSSISSICKRQSLSTGQLKILKGF